MRRLHAGLCVMLLGAAAPAFAQTPPVSTMPPPGRVDPNLPPPFVTEQPLVRFTAVNPREPEGDRLEAARRLAAAVVAQDRPNPAYIVDVGSFTGEFLEAFMEQFPTAKGQWTEPVDNNHKNAIRRLGHYGPRVNFTIGCPNRDISLGCVPKGVDVLITSWLSIHQNLAGVRHFYKLAADMVPSGGWVVNLDHVAYGGGPWEKRFAGARQALRAQGTIALTEGPPVHHPDYVVPTLEDHLAAYKAAGIDDVQVVWRRLNTVLLMGRKK